MRIVVKDRRYGATLKARYTFDWNIDYRTIPADIPLTQKVLMVYKKTKSPIGYATFRGLNKDDIRSILSAVKRQEAHVNVDRMGNCAYYKLDMRKVK